MPCVSNRPSCSSRRPTTAVSAPSCSCVASRGDVADDLVPELPAFEALDLIRQRLYAPQQNREPAFLADNHRLRDADAPLRLGHLTAEIVDAFPDSHRRR